MVQRLIQPADKLPIAPVETVTLAVYRDEQGGDALWQEAQNVVVGADGRYNVMMGSTTTEGLPLDLFTAGEPRWLGVRFNRGAEVEQPRVQLASVPYALKAIDADSLGGRPAAAYTLANPPGRGEWPVIVGGIGAAPAGGANPPFETLTAGTAGRIGEFVDPANLGNSTKFGTCLTDDCLLGRVGVGTTTPLDYLHMSFEDPHGAFTGLAVQNRSGGANASSGMLFFDQNGVLCPVPGLATRRTDTSSTTSRPAAPSISRSAAGQGFTSRTMATSASARFRRPRSSGWRAT